MITGETTFTGISRRARPSRWKPGHTLTPRTARRVPCRPARAYVRWPVRSVGGMRTERKADGEIQTERERERAKERARRARNRSPSVEHTYLLARTAVESPSANGLATNEVRVNRVRLVCRPFSQRFQGKSGSWILRDDDCFLFVSLYSRFNFLEGF